MAAPPVVAASIHLRAAVLLTGTDRKRALELLDQSLVLASGIPPDQQKHVGGNVRLEAARRAIEIDEAKAMEILDSLPPNDRQQPLRAAVQFYLKNNRVDAAFGAFEKYAPFRYYLFDVAGRLLSALPDGDPRRITLFGQASQAFQAEPDEQFFALLAGHASTLPRPLVAAAVRHAAAWAAAYDDAKESVTINYSGAGGSLSFSKRSTLLLFRILPVARKVDPDLAAEMAKANPELNSALERFPEGLDSISAGGALSMSSMRGAPSTPEAARTGARLQSAARQQPLAAQALKEASQDLDKALATAESISDPALRARTFVSIARAAGTKSPASARPILSKCLSLVADLKDADDRLAAWTNLARAAMDASQSDLARQALTNGFDAALEVHALDTDSERPNRAPRNMWPSVYYLRQLAFQAAKIEGHGASSYLARLNDASLNAEARIEMAAALLGQPGFQGSGFATDRRKKE